MIKKENRRLEATINANLYDSFTDACELSGKTKSEVLSKLIATYCSVVRMKINAEKKGGVKNDGI